MSSRSDRKAANKAIFWSGCFACFYDLERTQYLDVQVRSANVNGAPINQALISVFQAGTTNLVLRSITDRRGDAIIRLAPGNYKVRAQKAWHVPDLVEVDNQNLALRTALVVPLNMAPLQFLLHVDGDRDGVVDNQSEAPINTPAPAWAWGAGNRGAILPVNVDDDDANGNSDAADNTVNGVNDLNSDIAHIEIRRQGNAVAPVAWTATISVASPAGQANPRNNVRIFNGVAANSVEIVGPTTVAAANLAANPLTLGMEATRYAGAGFDGVVSVRLTIACPDPLGGGNLTYYSEAQMRAASWIMPNHLDRADTVYVSDLSNYLNPLDALDQATTRANSVTFRNTLRPIALNAGSPLNERAYVDRWMQDCMEIGYSTWPGTRANALAPNSTQRMESVMRAHRQGDLLAYPPTLRGLNFGYTHPGLGASTTFDSTGNLECTPPCDATAAAANGAGPKNYAWGRIYYGPGRPPMGGMAAQPFNVAVRDFLHGQEVQKPIELNTDWLNVGHVDEMMSFIPTPGGNKKWKLLIASPQDAYDILGDINTGTIAGGTGVDEVLGTALMPQQLEFRVWLATGNTSVNDWRRRYVDLDMNTTVAAMLGNAHSNIPKPGSPRPGAAPVNINDIGSPRFTWEEIRTWNLDGVQPILDAIVTQLQDEISLHPVNDVIRVPIVFFPVSKLLGVPQNADRIDPNLVASAINTIPGRTGGYVAGALTAGMVNMLVVNNTLVIPQPFGPVTGGVDQFWHALETRLTTANANLNPEQIDDWSLYHACEGEVHCGTNTLRKPSNANMAAWLTSNAAKWWEFPG